MSTIPKLVTFTGIDERTDMDRAVSIGKRYPVEWGVLMSPKRQGREPRYPHGKTVSAIAREYLLRLAGHVCGGHARALMEGGPLDLPTSPGNFNRIQVNHRSPDPDIICPRLAAWRVGVVFQCRAAFPDDEHVEWLFDVSGGHGVRPTAWPAHPGRRRWVGYSGGIGPDNVAATIEAIGSDGNYWIDMESGVRTDDWLDLDKCEAVCRTIWPAEQRASRGTT